MRFKDFEIRPATFLDRQTDPKKWHLVKWCKRSKPERVYDLSLGEYKMSDTYCFTVAAIEWDENEPCWEFRSFGTRFLEFYEEGLCEFVLKWTELASLTRSVEHGN